MKTVAIVNPFSGRQQTLPRWFRLIETSGAKPGHITTWQTRYPGHAEILAMKARREGFDRVIVAGGDGTLSETVNGLWREPAGHLPVLGMIPFGTGCDYVRNFDLGTTLEEKMATALGDALVQVSMGICHLQDMDGNKVRRCFINVLGMGYDANVVAHLRRHRLCGTSAYLYSALRELIRLKSFAMKGSISGKPFESDMFLFAVGLGKYFGGGMMITPDACVRGTRFQLVWGQYPGSVRLLRLMYQIYTGRHMSHPRVHTCPADHLNLISDVPVYVEADGELIGQTPVRIEICPGALRVAARGMR